MGILNHCRVVATNLKNRFSAIKSMKKISTSSVNCCVSVWNNNINRSRASAGIILLNTKKILIIFKSYVRFEAGVHWIIEDKASHSIFRKPAGAQEIFFELLMSWRFGL